MCAKKSERPLYFVRLSESAVDNLTDPDRYQGKQGLACVLYIRLAMDAASAEQTFVPIPDGDYKRFVEELHQRFGWDAKLIDETLRLLAVHGHIKLSRWNVEIQDAERALVRRTAASERMQKVLKKRAAAKRIQELTAIGESTPPKPTRTAQTAPAKPAAPAAQKATQPAPPGPAASTPPERQSAPQRPAANTPPAGRKQAAAEPMKGPGTPRRPAASSSGPTTQRRTRSDAETAVYRPRRT